MKIIAIVPSSQLVTNVVRDVIYGCWCSGKRIGGATVPPLSLLNVATMLKSAGFDVEFLDALALRMPWDEIITHARKADLVVMNSATMSYKEDADLLGKIKQANPSIISIVFGSHTTFLPESAMSFKSVDIIVRGEPERAILSAVEHLRDSRSLTGIPGVYCRENRPCDSYDTFGELLEDLDSMSFLNVDMLPKNVDYFNPIIRRLPYMVTETSRGCPAQCSFCTAPRFFGNKIRSKSVHHVLDEIGYFLEKGYNEIYFRDETFTYHKQRTADIAEGILERDYNVTWLANARVGNLDKETMMLMKRSGCHYLKFGVESGVQEVLDRSRKQIQVEQVVEDFQTAREVGIDTHGHFMLGMPGETQRTIETTLDFIKTLPATTVTIGICTPFPGTPLFDELLRKEPGLADGLEADLGNEHYQSYFNEHYTDGLTNHQLQASMRRGYRKFYLRPSYILRRLLKISDLAQLRNLIIAGLNIFSFSIGHENKQKSGKSSVE